MIYSVYKLLLVGMFLGPALALADESSARVTLQDAKRYAVERNLDVLALRRAADEKKANAGLANSAFFPRLGVAGGAETNRGGDAAALGYLYGNFNVFRGFEDTYKSQVAAIESEIVDARLRQAEFRVGLDVEQQFHLYLLKKVVIALKDAALELNAKHKGMAAKRRSRGLSASSDVMEFELRDSLIRSDLMLLGQELKEARIRLRKLLGEEVGARIEPAGSLQHQHLKGELKEYILKIKDTSETVRIANRELARSNVEAKLWRARWLPVVDVEAQAGYLNLDNRPPTGGLGVRGVVLAKFDLFSGFSGMWERRAGEAKQLKAEAQLKRALQEVLGDTEAAYVRLRTIQDRVDVEDQNESRAKRYYDAVIDEYRRGLKNSADVKVAAEMLFETRIRRESFKFDFLKERLELERSLGSPIETELVHD